MMTVKIELEHPVDAVDMNALKKELYTRYGIKFRAMVGGFLCGDIDLDFVNIGEMIEWLWKQQEAASVIRITTNIER